jgi:anti-anti-sigma factor
MQAKVSRHDHYWVVSYEGDTVGIMPGPLPEVLSALQEGAHEIILDFSRLRFLNPNGIKALKESLDAAKRREANIGIASPRPQVRRVLKLSGLTPEIPIYFSQLEAISKLDLVDYQTTARQELTDRLLVCQKDLPIARDLRKALKKHPLKPQFRMAPVRDLKRAYQFLLEEKVDCILIESSYPLFQVTQFIERVETDDRLPDIPIVVVASDKDMDEADLMIRNGAHEMLRYPFHPVEVLVRLQTLISHLKDHRPFVPPEKVVQPRGWRA